jgi:hypothetical protein
MPSAKSLITKVSAAIKKVGPMARTTSKRITVDTGGDPLIGVDGTVTNYDTVFSPQPIYRQLGHRQALFQSSATLQLVADDYKFTFPVTQVSKEDFEDPRIRLVMADVNGEEVLRILYISSEDYQGADVVINVFARSIGYYNLPESALTTPTSSPNQTVEQYVDAQIAAEEAAEDWGTF